jgi:hypothetical protein
MAGEEANVVPRGSPDEGHRVNETTIRRNCGRASLHPDDDVVAGTYGTWEVTYTVGRLGMDDGSTLTIASHQTSDWGTPQFSDPTAENYATVETDGDATLTATFDPKGHVRPWKHAVRIDVADGALETGEEITLTLGDTSEGSPGHRAQSFVEHEFSLRVLVDMVRTGEFVELPDDLSFDVVPAPADSLAAVVSATAEPDESATLSVRAEDRWGNVATDYAGSLDVRSEADAIDRPDRLAIEDGVGTATVTAREPGTYRVTVSDPETGLETTSNPLVCEADPDRHLYWGDIHGQSGETVGTGTIREHFEFLRDSAFLDFGSHAANDFQITDEFWETIQATIREFHEPEAFVTFLCYEWSANTPNGGDHNVYFRDDAAAIHRSSNWQVGEDAVKHEGTYPIEALYDEFRGRDDVLVIPHQGGRPATLDATDPALTPAVEIVSVWGVFEWFGQEALERGYDVGFVGGSDDHTGRPGTGPPDNLAKHNVKGGLTAAPVERLTREDLWRALEERRFYATTGARTYLETAIDGRPMGSHVDLDAASRMQVTVRGTAPIEAIDLFRAGDRLATESFAPGDDLLELRWQGARSKARDKLLDWSGGLRIDGGDIETTDEFGFDHPDQGITDRTTTALEWTAATTGNAQGVRLGIRGPPETTVSIETDPVTASFDLAEATDGLRFEGEHLDERLTVTTKGRPTELDVETSFELPAVPGPYFVRVRQWDGERAWSAPTFVAE